MRKFISWVSWPKMLRRFARNLQCPTAWIWPGKSSARNGWKNNSWGSCAYWQSLPLPSSKREEAKLCGALEVSTWTLEKSIDSIPPTQVHLGSVQYSQGYVPFQGNSTSTTIYPLLCLGSTTAGRLWIWCPRRLLLDTLMVFSSKSGETWHNCYWSTQPHSPVSQLRKRPPRVISCEVD